MFNICSLRIFRIFIFLFFLSETIFSAASGGYTREDASSILLPADAVFNLRFVENDIFRLASFIRSDACRFRVHPFSVQIGRKKLRLRETPSV